MSLNQKRSFYAHLEYNGSRLTFRNLLNESYPASEANVLTTLPSQPRHPAGPTRTYPKFIAYFACYEDYYNIEIRGHGYFAHYIRKGATGKLSAMPGAGGKTTSFNLLDDNKRIITLDDLGTNNANIYLKARNAGIIQSNSNAQYFSERAGTPLKFNLEILQRNVDYPGATPDTYEDLIDED
jgi:hypothetical protein